MTTIQDITARQWLTFMCHGYIDNSGNFCKTKEKAMSFIEPVRLNSRDVDVIRDCLEEIKESGVTKKESLAYQYGPYCIYPALPTIKSLVNRYMNYPIASETTLFFNSHSDPFGEGAFDHKDKEQVRSVNQMYIVEVDVSESTDTESTMADAKLHFLLDGVNRLTLVQERLSHIYGRQNNR